MDPIPVFNFKSKPMVHYEVKATVFAIRREFLEARDTVRPRAARDCNAQQRGNCKNWKYFQLLLFCLLEARYLLALEEFIFISGMDVVHPRRD